MALGRRDPQRGLFDASARFRYDLDKLGYKYDDFSCRTGDQRVDKQFEADVRLSGATLALIVRS